MRVKRSSFLVVGLTLIAASANAAIWPEMLAGSKRLDTKPVEVTDRTIWEEYGLAAAEEARFESDKGQFTATAFRLRDSTGAMAAWQWQRPADARASKLADLAAETADGVLLVYGNYLLRFDGFKPASEELQTFLDRLPKLEKAALPTLSGYLPSRGLVPNSERYVIGPASLAAFKPKIPPSLAAFHAGTEVQLATYREGKGAEMELALFSYPTPHIAREQLAKFEQLPGAIVKRSGPLLAVLLSPPDPDAAERLLAGVRYEASVTLNQRMPTQRDNPGDLILNALILTGILLGFCIFAGLAFGGFRAASRRLLGDRGMDQPMILLDLSKK